jgi:DNA polymerase
MIFAGRRRVGNLMVEDLCFIDEIKRGILPKSLRFGGVALAPADTSDLMVKVDGCSRCVLRNDCSKTTPFSPTSSTNIMIVGEAPGADEEKVGKPFIGRAGKILWEKMAVLGLARDMFHVTNVSKCRPADNKITDQNVELVMQCGAYHLKDEITRLAPVLIFSLGKTAARFFTGDKHATITDRNAVVEWNERWGSFIVYGIHPAMALYSPTALPLLEQSVEAFANMFVQLA